MRGGTPPAGKERYSQTLPFQSGYNSTWVSYHTQKRNFLRIPQNIITLITLYLKHSNHNRECSVHPNIMMMISKWERIVRAKVKNSWVQIKTGKKWRKNGEKPQNNDEKAVTHPLPQADCCLTSLWVMDTFLGKSPPQILLLNMVLCVMEYPFGQPLHLRPLPTSCPTPAKFLGKDWEIRRPLMLWVHDCKIAKRLVCYQPWLNKKYKKYFTDQCEENKFHLSQTQHKD